MSESPQPAKWFRQARPAGAGWNLQKTAAQTAVFWALFLWVLPSVIAALEQSIGIAGFPAQMVTGWTIFAVAGALGLASGYTMATAGRGTPLPTDCPRRLVTTGPYAYVRNPMAIAGLTQGAAAGLVLGSWGVLAYVLAGGLFWNTLVRPVEEAHLEELFGDAFRDYRSRVRCWMPARNSGA